MFGSTYEPETKIKGTRSSKQNTRAADKSLQTEVESIPEKRMKTKQKISNDAKESAQPKSTTNRVENKGNKRKKPEELPLEVDVKAQPAKRMSRQKLMKESELTQCEN